MVAESLYDFEGRNSLGILAVPATDAKLTFKSGFNNFQSVDPKVSENTSSSRKKFNYDNRRLENSIVDNTSGAGNYYSSANSLSSIHKDYIPDAEGFVYSQTEYLNDGTGRIARQSGIGKEFKMDGNHITRYFYGNATSEELIRLFGSNVGNATHYKKSLVVDPNGQVNVSYVDQAGRTIATALAGDKPANVTALESLTNLDLKPLSVDISDKNEFENGISVTTHKLLNTSPNTNYNFKYGVDALGSFITGLGCQTCSYDLKITLTDPDGKLVNLGAITGNQAANNFSYLQRDITAANCTSPSHAEVAFDILLTEIGDYTITKSLIPHELSFVQMQQVLKQNVRIQASIDSITQAYKFDPSDCDVCTSLEACPDAESLIDQAIDEIAALDCDNLYQQIISFYKEQHASEEEVYEPTNAEITSHELYCQYEVCVKDQESDAFEKQMARIANWNDAASAGYTNISTMLNSKDPFFANPNLSGSEFKGTMEGKLNNIQVATIEGHPFGGAINSVLDPTNTNFYINDDV